MAEEITAGAAAPSAAVAAAPIAAPRPAPKPRRRRKKYSVLTWVAMILIIGAGFRYMVGQLPHTDLHSREAVWDSYTRDTTRYTVLSRGSSCTVEVHNTGLKTSGFYSGKPGSLLNAAHEVHTKVVTVIEGTLAYGANASEAAPVVLEAGKTLTILPGAPHVLWNAGEGALTYTVTLSPCDDGAEGLYEQIGGLGADAKSLQLINPLQLLLTLRHYKVAITELPPWLRPVVDCLLLPIGKLFGLQPTYDAYRTAGRSTPAPTPAAATPEPEAAAEAAELEAQQVEEVQAQQQDATETARTEL